MQVQRIPAGIYQANCYLVMDDTTREAVLIDPAGDAPFLLKKIREQEADVKAILLTHGHGDHIGAAQELKDTLSVPILAHKDEVKAKTVYCHAGCRHFADNRGYFLRSHDKTKRTDRS
jgi:hydroxyacylglutathione hydrolase